MKIARTGIILNTENYEKCTAFFFACTRQRKAEAAISQLRTENGLVENKKEVDNVLYNFYKELYQKVERSSSRDWYEGVPRLTQDQQLMLAAPLKKTEVQKVLFKEMK